MRLAEEDRNISAQVVACSELVYTTKGRLLQVGNDVKQLQEAKQFPASL